MQTLEGETIYINHSGRHKKTQHLKWSGSITPKKNKTVRCYLKLSVDKQKLEIDVDIEANKDATLNVKGYMIGVNGRKQQLNLNHVSPNDSIHIEKAMRKLV